MSEPTPNPRVTTAATIAERQEAARSARLDAAQADGFALLAAKLRAGGDPTKWEQINAILELGGVAQQHGAAINEMLDRLPKLGGLFLLLVRYACDLDVWYARPWWIRRRRNRPTFPAALASILDRPAELPEPPGEAPEVTP